MKIRSLVPAAALIAAIGCDDQPTTPTPVPSATIQLFAGTLAPRDSGFFSFTLESEATVDLTFASLTPTPLGPALPSALSLGLGTPRGTGCATTTTLETSTGLTAQLSSLLAPGTYCVNLSDPGTMPAASEFVVRIVRTPTDVVPPDPEAPSTVTFASNLTAGGTASRTFQASQDGIVSLTLESVGPPSVAIGIGVGIVRLNNTCGLSRIVTATPGTSPQLEVPVDAGNYCVRVFDIGTIADSVAFSLRVAHP